MNIFKWFKFPKYRIIEQTNENGEKYFIAQVKEDIFAIWLNIAYCNGSYGHGSSYLVYQIHSRCKSFHEAEENIKGYKQHAKEQEERIKLIRLEAAKAELKTVKITPIN